jgi:hypothetical protein
VETDNKGSVSDNNYEECRHKQSWLVHNFTLGTQVPSAKTQRRNLGISVNSHEESKKNGGEYLNAPARESNFVTPKCRNIASRVKAADFGAKFFSALFLNA